MSEQRGHGTEDSDRVTQPGPGPRARPRLARLMAGLVGLIVVFSAAGAVFLAAGAVSAAGAASGPADGPTLERLTRDRLTPSATAIALGALVLSLALAFRREGLPAPSPAGDPPLPEPLRQARLFRLRYGLSLEQGHLRAGGRSGRRLSLETTSGQTIAWRAPDAGFAAADPAHPDRTLQVLAAGGRAIASIDPVTGRVALHEADLARLHGLGRRGRTLILWPLVLATAAYALLVRQVLGDFLARDAALSAHDRQLALLVTIGFFTLGELALLGASLTIVSAVLGRVRRVQLRRRYEDQLRSFLASVARHG